MPEPKFKRVLLKVTGEGFGRPVDGIYVVCTNLECGARHVVRPASVRRTLLCRKCNQPLNPNLGSDTTTSKPIDLPPATGVNLDAVETIAGQIAQTAELGVQIAVVVGGGNILRGSKLAGDPRIQEATAHYMGMIGTVINALVLQDVLERKFRVDTRVQSAIEMNKVAEPFLRRRAIRHLEQKRVVILAGGLGSPFFTTDTCAAQRAGELGADVLLKGTNVDGVYSADPKTDPKAVRFDRITYGEFMSRNLRVMDQTAIAFCREHGMPVVVFDLGKAGAVRRVVLGEPVGTWIVSEARLKADAGKP